MCLSLHHVRQTANTLKRKQLSWYLQTSENIAANHVTGLDGSVLLDDRLERLEEVLLEVVVAQLVLGQEFLGQLPERVNGVHGDAQVLMAADLFTRPKG